MTHFVTMRDLLWHTLRIVVCFLFFTTGITHAATTNIGWTTDVVAQTGTFTRPPSDLLGPPTGISIAVSDSQSVEYGSMNDVVSYDSDVLAGALGLSIPELGTVDLLLFDANNNSVGFEQSTITVSGTVNTLTIIHAGINAPATPPVLRNGFMSKNTFDSLFGANLDSTHAGFLAFDLSRTGMNVFGSNFTVEIVGGGSSPTAAVPDLAGIGVVNAVPVPPAAWLFGSGLLGLVGIARRKKAT